MAAEPDPQVLLRELGVQGVQRITPITSGSSTLVWRVEHGQHVSALRMFRADQQPAFQREHAALELAASHGIPVPQVRAHGSWQERPLVLLSWCEGQPLRDTLRRLPWRLIPLCRAFGRMQARIHQIRPTPLPGTTPNDWITWYNAADSRLAAHLRRAAAPVPSLLHLDYHPMNVLAQRSAIGCVLDWPNARTGDPRADVARTYAILAILPHYAGREPLWYTVVRRLIAQNWLYGYQTQAGKQKGMPLFFAWAGAVMCADLAPQVANPQAWLEARHLEVVERWAAHWRQQVSNGNIGQTG